MAEERIINVASTEDFSEVLKILHQHIVDAVHAPELNPL